MSASVEAGGARLFPIRLPGPSRLALGVNGSPLMQMTVFDADGRVLEARGPLRVVSLSRVTRSPVQLLVTNDGVAPALITLSLRPDPVLEQPAAGADAPGSAAATPSPQQQARPQLAAPAAEPAAPSAPVGSGASEAPPLTAPPPLN